MIYIFFLKIKPNVLIEVYINIDFLKHVPDFIKHSNI